MNAANQLVIDAVNFQEQGNIDEAAKLFKIVLSSHPNDIASLFSLALIHFKKL